VQIEELPSLNRLRRTRAVMNRLRPMIAEAQGQLTPEEIQMKAAEAGQAASSPAVPARPVIFPSEPLKHYHGRAHLILFWFVVGTRTMLNVVVFRFGTSANNNQNKIRCARP